MTYPQYAPPQQPQGYPSQSYAPAYPPAPPAAQQGQPIAPPVPQLRNGSGGAGVPAPKFRHLLGRTIIVEPIRVDEDAMDTSVNPPVKRPEAYFHLTVVDGGPVQYGDSQDRDVSKQRPNTHESDVPCRFTNVNDRSFGFVQAVRDALAAGEPGRVGVVQQGTKGNKPYLITKTGTDVLGNERPDGEARFAAAMDLFGKIWHDKHAPAGAPKQFVSPEPRSLVAPPAAAVPQVNYAAPAQAPQQHAGYGQQPPAPPAYGGVPAANGYYMPAAPPAPAPAAPALPPAVEQWLATLPPELAAQQRTAYLANQAPAGPGI